VFENRHYHEFDTYFTEFMADSVTEGEMGDNCEGGMESPDVKKGYRAVVTRSREKAGDIGIPFAAY
jgi:hypothetical protein